MFDRIVLQEKAEQAEEMKANALEKEALEEQNASVKIAGDRAELLDSKLPEPRGSKIGPTDPDAEITVTIMVKSVASEQEVNRTLEDIASGKRKPLSDAEFNASFGADPMAMSKVLRFAASSGLSVEKCDMNASQIQLKGKVRDFSKAFNHTDRYQ